MNKYILFAIIISIFLLSCLFLFQLLNQRNNIKSQYILEKEEQKKIKMQNAIEGLSMPTIPTFNDTQTSESNNIATKIYNQLSTTNQLSSQNNNYPIKKLCTFSSWNTACSGTFVSTDQIINVIASGCRMLHFTITNYGKQPMIFGNFTDNSGNGILLQDALQKTMDNAFNFSINLNTNSGKQTVNLNNYTDPLFVMLSFKYFSTSDIEKYNKKMQENPDQILANPYYSKKFFEKCANIVKNIFNNRLHVDGNGDPIRIDSGVLKNQINQKVIIITDITGLNNSTNSYDHMKKLLKCSNIQAGVIDNGILIYPFSDLISNKIEDKNDNNLILAFPDKDKNQTVKKFIECSFYQLVHFIPVLFYNTKSDSVVYNTNNDFVDIMKHFQENNSAFLTFQNFQSNVLHPDSSTKATMGSYFS